MPRHATVATDALNLTWHVTHDPYGVGLDTLVGLALRDNPKRAHLIVSKVLAKHVPVRPAAARAAGLLLAGLVHQCLGGQVHPELTADLLTDPDRSDAVQRLATGTLPGAPIVIGYCETATSLGHTVADAFTAATYAHTTRHPASDVPPLLAFDEEHSHAVAPYLQPVGTDLHRSAPVVLVDDELTTGMTALNTIEALRTHRPYPRFVIGVLLDMRAPATRAAFEQRAAKLGVSVDVVALLDGHLTLPADVLDRAESMQASLRQLRPQVAPPRSSAAPYLPRHWPDTVPFTARHGFAATNRAAFEAEIDRLAQQLTHAEEGLPARLHGHGPVLVLGTEECMIAAIRLAHAIDLHYAASGRPRTVHVQSTTRSPVLPHDTDGYAIRRAVAFDCPTEAGRASYLYNGAPLDRSETVGSPAGYEHIVVLTDASPDRLVSLADALAPFSANRVLLLADRGGR